MEKKHTCLDKCTRQDETPRYNTTGPGELDKASGLSHTWRDHT